MRLGIVHHRIQPSSPQQDGAHERMHRTLQASTTRPPAKNRVGQQKKFDAFIDEFNNLRPHESLDDDTPASRYRPSPRPFPERIPKPEYPGHCEHRRVSNAGCFRFGSRQVFLSQALGGDVIGLEEIDDGLWNILFCSTLLGRFDERTGKISGADFRTDAGGAGWF